MQVTVGMECHVTEMTLHWSLVEATSTDTLDVIGEETGTRGIHSHTEACAMAVCHFTTPEVQVQNVGRAVPS